jgi:hypothetical protein
VQGNYLAALSAASELNSERILLIKNTLTIGDSPLLAAVSLQSNSGRMPPQLAAGGIQIFSSKLSLAICALVI